MRSNVSNNRNDDGFTLVELLVVMVIVGVLCAIAIPVFMSQRGRAHDSAAKADASTLGKELATYYVDHTAAPTLAIAAGHYVLAGDDLGPASANISIGSTDFVDATHWCVDVTNPSGRVQTFKYSALGGLGSGSCTAADVA
jgi:prepilin-type N-terminal cleavage/methylation domain-containing protein